MPGLNEARFKKIFHGSRQVRRVDGAKNTEVSPETGFTFQSKDGYQDQTSRMFALVSQGRHTLNLNAK